MKYPENYLQIEQGSPSWFQVRCGKVTASRIADVSSRLKNGKSSAARDRYKLELLTEALTGYTVEHYVSPAMDFGVENEPVARASYEMAAGIEVERIGFVLHPNIERAGASPDGLVGEDGLVEIKVPNTMTHLEYLLAGVAPEQYRPQMLWQMACTGRKWCDFVSYDPRVPPEYGLFVVRLERDEKAIAAMEFDVIEFIKEVNGMAEGLLKYKGAHEVVSALRPERAAMPDWRKM